MEQTIVVVELGLWDRDPEAFTEAFGAALVADGFVALTDHGVDEAWIASAYDAAAAFFALDEATKRACERPDIERQRGYTPFGLEHAKDSAHPDLKEFFHLGREVEGDGAVPANVWPAEAPALREASLRLFGALDAIAVTLLDALGRYLGLPHRALVDLAANGNSVMRLIHYPVCAGHEHAGAVRAAAHEDINLMTLLPPSAEAGLELLQRDGSWRPVRAVPGQLIVDTGDMMSRITAGRVPATTHRVVNPTGPATPRFSMPFFVHPHPDAVLEVFDACLAPGRAPTSPPITAHDFLLERLRAIGVAS